MSTSTITVGGQQVTLVSFPTSPGPKAVEFSTFDAVGIVRSVFTGQAQAQQWPGADLLSGTLSLAPINQAAADDWISFLMQLRGMANAFQLGDPLQPKARGSLSGFPVVDNSVASGNAAGSQTLGVKGFTANALNVLRRGDWIALDYRLYRVLDDVNADAAGKAIFPIWPSLREQPTSDGGSAGWLNATASIGYTQSRPLGNNTAAVTWSNFSLIPGSVLPPDAVIQGIYPVMVASANYDIADSYYSYFTPSAGYHFLTPSDPDGQTFASTEFYAPSIGTTLAAIADYKMRILLNTTLNQDSITDTANATAAGFAIYYTSATPYMDPQMVPPFAVPAGQGIAWSIPYTVEQSGNLPGGSGIFDPSTGYAYGTAAVYNGGLLGTGAKGLFRLSQNKRGWAADLTRLSRISIPFEEYR